MLIAKNSLLDCKYFCSGDETGLVRLLGNKMKTIRFGWFSVSERRFIFNYCCVLFRGGLGPWLYLSVVVKEEKKEWPCPALPVGWDFLVMGEHPEPQIWRGAGSEKAAGSSEVYFGESSCSLGGRGRHGGFSWDLWVHWCWEGRGRVAGVKMGLTHPGIGVFDLHSSANRIIFNLSLGHCCN